MGTTPVHYQIPHLQPCMHFHWIRCPVRIYAEGAETSGYHQCTGPDSSLDRNGRGSLANDICPSFDYIPHLQSDSSNRTDVRFPRDVFPQRVGRKCCTSDILARLRRNYIIFKIGRSIRGICRLGHPDIPVQSNREFQRKGCRLVRPSRF
ncbi:hypothetical protein B0H14DRAFT_2951315 [Mycena olivaceomarginata]|nr:hypothetical protein B0H14DRAFT_2951315 [Mycena olivaceomarginata]